MANVRTKKKGKSKFGATLFWFVILSAILVTYCPKPIAVLIILCCVTLKILHAWQNAFMRRHGGDIVALNTAINKAQTLGIYFKNRDQLISMLKKASKFDLLTNAGNRFIINGSPIKSSRLLKMLESNKNESIRSAILRYYENLLSRINAYEGFFADEFDSEIIKFDSRLTNEHRIYAKTRSDFLHNREAALSMGCSTMLDMAAHVIFNTNQASVSMLQHKLHLEYRPAAELMQQLEELGVVSPLVGSNPRVILMQPYEYNAIPEHAKIKKSNITDNSDSQIGNNLLDLNTLSDIDKMDGHEFEHWCAALLMRNGFSDATVTPGSGDQGVDIVAVKDGVNYAIQCKCYSSPLDNTPVQEVYAGKEMYNCQVGAVMTNNYFTSGANQLAEKTRVLLWDRDTLAAFIKSAAESDL